MLKAHAERDASEAFDPSQDTQRKHEERTIATLGKNADKLRTALATTTERIGAKGTPIKRNLTDADSATLKSGRGVLQGYIGVAAVDGAHQVIVEAQAHGSPQEHDLLKPVIDDRTGVRAHPATRPAPVHAARPAQGRHAMEALCHRPQRGQIAALRQAGRVGEVVPAKHASCRTRRRENSARQRSSNDGRREWGNPKTKIRQRGGCRDDQLDQYAALPGELKELLRDLSAHWAQLRTAIDACSARIDAHARQDARCVRIVAIVGVGPITVDAMVASVGNAREFRNGRQLAAWLGVVPTQHSSGGHTRLGTISCRGDAYLRTLLIQGARSSLQRAKAVSVAKSTPEQIWIRQLDGRMPFGKVLVAIANKHERQLWAMLAHDLDYDPHACVKHPMAQRPASEQAITVATMA